MSPGVSLMQSGSAIAAYFPGTYEEARTALAECARVDECQMWANKAAAIASYARQSKDETLKNLAVRIQDRAVRRLGELLNAQTSGRVAFAEAAGVSRLQRNQATSIAQIPAAKFDALVDSESPPKVYQLAAIGARRRTLSRTNKARIQDLRAEIKRLENKHSALTSKLERTTAQIVQAQSDLSACLERV